MMKIPKKTMIWTGSDGYQVRPGLLRDLPGLMALHLTVHEDGGLPRSRLRRYLRPATPGLGCFVALHHQHVRGYLLYTHSGREASMVDLATSPSHRRQGIATMLTLALSRFHPRPQAIVRDTNLAAQLFLRSMGFVCTKIRPRYFRRDCDGYLFKL